MSKGTQKQVQKHGRKDRAAELIAQFMGADHEADAVGVEDLKERGKKIERNMRRRIAHAQYLINGTTPNTTTSYPPNPSSSFSSSSASNDINRRAVSRHGEKGKAPWDSDSESDSDSRRDTSYLTEDGKHVIEKRYQLINGHEALMTYRLELHEVDPLKLEHLREKRDRARAKREMKAEKKRRTRNGGATASSTGKYVNSIDKVKGKEKAKAKANEDEREQEPEPELEILSEHLQKRLQIARSKSTKTATSPSKSASSSSSSRRRESPGEGSGSATTLRRDNRTIQDANTKPANKIDIPIAAAVVAPDTDRTLRRSKRDVHVARLAREDARIGEPSSRNANANEEKSKDENEDNAEDEDENESQNIVDLKGYTKSEREAIALWRATCRKGPKYGGPRSQ